MNAYEASLYIHIPFCIKKCDYCDFYSGCDLSIQDDLLHQIPLQMEELCRIYGVESFSTVYLGGGTPGLVNPISLGEMLEGVKQNNKGILPSEVTLECNPGNIRTSRLREWKQMGVTRLSLGVQSFQDDFLIKAGRKSNRKQIIHALELISRFSYFNVSLDLIQGLPGMSRSDQLRDIEEALSWNPDHISWYSLILEEGSILEKEWDIRNGDLQIDNDAVWEDGCSLLENSGYNRYEVSNFCKKDKESRHNKNYWKLNPYLGCGPSAVSMLRNQSGRAVRFRTVPESREFSSGSFLYDQCETLSSIDFLKDFILMGLRLKEGIGEAVFSGIFGYPPELLFPDSLKKWMDAGGLMKNDHALMPTRLGMNLLNSILIDLFSELDERRPEISIKWPSE